MKKLKTPKAWTQHARGQDCTMRLFQVCNFNPETTVFAHSGDGGMGMKSLWGAFACSDCHDAYDGRAPYPDIYRHEIAEAHSSGCFETMEILIRDGILKI